MARTNSDDLLMEDDLAAAFLGGDDETPATKEEEAAGETEETPQEEGGESVEDDGGDWGDTDDFPGQLAVDVYETADKLVVKARTAGMLAPLAFQSQILMSVFPIIS